jgi:hypothetical protein
VVANYFTEGPWQFSWSLSKEEKKHNKKNFTSLAFHRTLATYVNELLEVGFVLKKLKEPKPSRAACEQNPRLKVARDVAPSFLFLQAGK